MGLVYLPSNPPNKNQAFTGRWMLTHHSHGSGGTLIRLASMAWYPSKAWPSWWFQPNWEILVKLDHFPKDRGKNSKKYLSCHHLDHSFVIWFPKWSCMCGKDMQHLYKFWKTCKLYSSVCVTTYNVTHGLNACTLFKIMLFHSCPLFRHHLPVHPPKNETI